MITEGQAGQNLKTLEQASRNSKAVQYIEQKIPTVDATLLCVSYAEAKFGRLFFKPITVPGRIWLSLKGAKLWRQMNVAYKEHDAIEAKGLKGMNKMSAMKSSFIETKSNKIFKREFAGLGVQSLKKHHWQRTNHQ